MLDHPVPMREVLRWLARGLSVLSTSVLLLFVLGEPFPIGRITAVQWLGLSLFPLGVIVGFIVAWWKEGLGALITLGSLVAFYVVFGFLLNGNLKQGGWFVVFASPAFLFFLSWALGRARRAVTT